MDAASGRQAEPLVEPGVRLADVEIRHLAALEAVAAEGGFGRAAHRLGFTQSAVSQQIASFERALGQPLFDRPGGPRPVELTPVGRCLLEHARAILSRLRRAEEDVSQLLAGTGGSLVIGTFQSVSVKVLPEVIGHFRAERPHVAIRLFESDDLEELLGNLVSGELDLTFTSQGVGQLRVEGVAIDELWVDPFVVVAPRGRFDTPSIAPVALVGEPLIGQPDNTCHAQIDRNLRDAGVEPRYVFRSADNGAVQAMVRAGMGMSVMPLLAVDIEDPEVTVLALEPPIPPRAIGLARRADRSASEAAQRFAELSRAVFAERAATLSV